MGYQIQYDSKPIYKGVKEISINRKKWIFICTAVLLVGLCFIPSVRNTLVQWIVPFDPEVTRNAFSDFVETLHEGEPFHDAFMVFCREILKNA